MFFRDRVVNKDQAHMRAFASEVISVISALGIFVDVVVKPSGVVAANVVCFDRLREIVGLLTSGDQAVKNVDVLKRTLLAHHDCYAMLYPQCMKPKIHYLKHAVDCIQKFVCNLSCFGPERKHRDAKQIAACSYNKAFRANYNCRNASKCVANCCRLHAGW